VPAPLLLLFDIDGTLVQGATTAHAEALHRALRAVHGIDPAAVRSGRAVAGRTDNEIARLILLDAGISAERIDDRADAVREQCCRIYATLASEDLSHTVLPGIPELLEDLRRREDVRLGLLTGNFEPVGRMKLAQAGLGHHFADAVGAFGSDSEDRTMLPAIARRRAGSTGRPHPRERTIVIGDTPRDIACARADGVRCIAVTTGPHDAAALRDADHVVGGAAELGPLLQRLLG
jgi:phosphoglycolate phosphatase-like HAD superfamily hydrolase